MTWLRRLVGAAALLAAAWWLGQAILEAIVGRDVEPVYPNEYGVRLRPLSRDELADALERELALRRIGAWQTPPAPLPSPRRRPR